MPKEYLSYITVDGNQKHIKDIDARSAMGDLQNLTTSEKTDTVSAINELDNIIKTLPERNLYGVRFDSGANSGVSVHRLHNAVGMIAEVGTDTETCRNDFDNAYPWASMRRCCCTINGSNFKVNAYKGEPDYIQDGSNGEVWVEIPCFWYTHTYSGESEEIVISATKRPGFLPSPLAMQFGINGIPAEYSYIPAYKLAMVLDQATSRTGVFSDSGSLNYFMGKTTTKNNNTSVTTTAEEYTLYLLMVTEFATRDLQSVMRGYSGYSVDWGGNCAALIAEASTNKIVVNTAKASSYIVGCYIGIGTGIFSDNVAKNRKVTDISVHAEGQTAITFDGDPVKIDIGNKLYPVAPINGTCDGVLTSSGSPVSNTSGKYDCIYRGIESPYSHSFSWLADLLFDRVGEAGSTDYKIMYLPDISKYANGAVTEDYVEIGYRLPVTDGYVKKFGFDPTYPHVRAPIEVGASSNTYNSDYYYKPNPNNKVCAAQLSGSWDDGSYCGPSFWRCGYSPALSYLYFRARLSFHR